MDLDKAIYEQVRKANTILWMIWWNSFIIAILLAVIVELLRK